MRKPEPRITFAAVFALALAAFSGGLYAMDWPSGSAVLIRNFGWNDRGSPVLGMVFEGEGEVLAAETGEVIFSRGRNDTASRLPSPLGQWTALDHGDGLISIYSRYGEESGRQVSVEKQSPVATAGISGWSAQKGFYFILYDRRERRWINPAMIITPIQNTRPLQILAVELRNAQGLPVDSAQLRNLSQGRYTISVATTNAARVRENLLAPYRIVCSINGAEAGSLNFEAFSARDGVLLVYRNGLVPVKRVYANSPAFEAAEVFLNRGQASLEIIVQDIAGNSRNALTRMIIN